MNSRICREQPSSFRIRSWLSLGIVLFGVLLRLRQYLANRSLWLDEATLALNIVNRSLVGLTRPLDYGQGAPIGFLLIEKVSICALGNRDYILRLFPFVAGVASILLMWKVAETYTEGTAPLLALGLFAVSDQVVYYASEVKQYSSDVLFSLLLLLFFHQSLGRNARRKHLIGLGLLGALAMWMSHPALFTITGISAALILDSIAGRKAHRLADVGGLLVLWIANFAVLYFVSLRHLAANTALIDYWRTDFMPMPPWRKPSWFSSALSAIFRNPVGLSATSISVVAFSAGCLSLIFRRWQLGLALTASLLAALLASGLRKYPFGGRLLLFVVPAVDLLIAEGAERFRLLIHRYSSAAAFGLWLALSAAMLYKPIGGAYHGLRQPWMREHIKPVISYVSQNKLEEDAIYVYSGAYPAFAYYSSQYGFEEGDYVIGVLSREEPRRYIEDIDKLVGERRVWFIFSHNCTWCPVNEKAYYLEHLGEVGTQLDAFKSSEASVYLYDLSTEGYD